MIGGMITSAELGIVLYPVLLVFWRGGTGMRPTDLSS